MNFKIYDRVKVVADGEKLAAQGLDDLALTGKKGVIDGIDINRKESNYAVDFGENVWCLYEEDLELVDTAGGFKVGDRVKVTAGGFKNNEGIIVSGKSQEIKNVKIGRGNFSIRKEDLELVNDVNDVKVEFVQDGEDVQYGHPRFYEILKEMAELHSRKNHDYAGTSDPLKNLRACERLELDPFMGVMVRLQDKWSRLEEFVKSEKLMVKGEGVKDTLMDNAVYSILAVILYEEQKKVNREGPFPGGA